MPQYVSAPYGRYPSVGETPQQEYVDVAGSVGGEIQKASELFQNMVKERAKSIEANRRWEAEMALKEKADERAEAQNIRQETRQDKEIDRWAQDDTRKEAEAQRRKDEAERTKTEQGRMDKFKEEMRAEREKKGRLPTYEEAKYLGIMHDVQDTPEYDRFLKTFYPSKYRTKSTTAKAEKIPDSGLGTEAEHLYYQYMRNPELGDQISREAFSKIAEAEDENTRLTELLDKYEGLKVKLDEAEGREKEIIQKQIATFESQMDFPTTAETIKFNTNRINDLKELDNMIKRKVATAPSASSGGGATSGTRKIPKKRTSMNAEDRRALLYAKNNPDNPNAKKILDRLKSRFPNEF